MPNTIAIFSLSILIGLAASSPGLHAQARSDAAGGWNAPEAIALVELGREARTALARESGLDTYRSLAEGHVYFFLDPERGERSLIRVDQVAVELTWEAPGRVQQHIVGERSETRLPVRDFDYYLDRVTLVPYGFGDEIRIGSGNDVAGVPHPLGRDDSQYDFRLADSLTLALPGAREPVRLYELDVRPRTPDRPGALGTLTLDRATGEVVRMAFTFTPASYVDSRTDWIAVELEYGLWEERHWLPHVQRIEVRREFPDIDLGVGTVIRSVLRVGQYELDVPGARSSPLAPPVTRAPEEDRLNYGFSEGLYEGLRRDGLADLRVDASVRQLRAEAVDRIHDLPPSALSPFRLHFPGPSTLLRYSRTEGTVTGIGGTLRPTSGLRIRGRAGYSFGRDRVQGALDLESQLSRKWTLEGEVRLDTPYDLGLTEAIDPLLSSVGAAFMGEDYRDPFHRSGAEVGLTYRPSVTRLSVGVSLDRARNAHLVSSTPPIGSRSFRPVRPITAGSVARVNVAARLPLTLPAEGRGWVDADLGILTGGPGTGLSLETAAETRWGPASGTREASLGLRSWHWWGDPLPQGHRLLGGRGTLPGFPFRVFAGRDVFTVSAQGSTATFTPVVRIRAAVQAGWAGRAEPGVSEMWDTSETGDVRTSVSLGLGLFWDIVRLDVARGLNGGEWQLLLGVNPAWWDRL